MNEGRGGDIKYTKREYKIEKEEWHKRRNKKKCKETKEDNLREKKKREKPSKTKIKDGRISYFHNGLHT